MRSALYGVADRWRLHDRMSGSDLLTLHRVFKYVSQYARYVVCLVFSYIFYGWWDWRFVFLLMTTTVMDYTLGRLMERNEDDGYRKRMIVVSVIMNLGFLGFFKYFNFFTDSIVRGMSQFGMQPSWTMLHIILPVGISFYTFQSMSYTIDIYRREIKAERDFIKFAAFVAFFPQLVAGPIVRASDFLPQFREEKTWDWNRVISGFTRILWGLFKKIAIADTIAPFVDLCFGSPGSFTSMHLAIGVFFYSFQIYCDFSGYSDIAIGLARILGFDFLENFKTPYFSKNFSEFWGRWHISLSSWLRDYLYIPLGGNRNGKWGTYRNNMLTMLIGGLWHGASWAFVFWGFLHGLYLIVQRLIGRPFGALMRALYFPKPLQTGINVTIVYLLTCFAWIYFRCGSFGNRSFAVANQVILGIADLKTFTWEGVIDKFLVMKGVLLIGILISVELSNFRFAYSSWALRSPIFRVASFVCLMLLLARFGTFGSKTFIYFQF